MSSNKSTKQTVEDGTLLFALPFLIVLGALWLFGQLLLMISRILGFTAAMQAGKEYKNYKPKPTKSTGGYAFLDVYPQYDPNNPLYHGNPNSPYYDPNVEYVDKLLNRSKDRYK